MKAANVFSAIAKEHGTSEAQVRADVTAVIHEAYLTGKPEFKLMFCDREPSPEEFILAIAKELTDAGKRPRQ